MNNVELARWMRDEHEKVGELSAILREKVATVPRVYQQKWLEEIRRSFSQLCAHHLKHMELEEQDGYLAVVVQKRPMLSGKVDLLAHEHHEIRTIMERIQEDLERIRAEDHLLMCNASERILSILACVEHHENEENLLVLSAFTDDIGTKD